MGLRKLHCKIVFIDTGEGFKTPAIAIAKQLKEKGVDVELCDIAKDHGSYLIDWLYKKGWNFCLRYPILYDLLYKVTDSRHRFLENMLFLKLKMSMREKLLEKKPDFIFSTHFSSTFHYSKIIKNLPEKIPLIAYNSDVLVAHSYWVCNDLECYFVPTKNGFLEMEKKGQLPHTLEISSFPIDDKFNKTFSSIAEERQKLGLKNSFTALLMMGGEGIGPMQNIVETIVATKLSIQLVVICGRNSKLKESLKRLNYPNVAIEGFVTNMQDYIYCSNIVLGKSGLNFVFESLYLKRPFITVKAMTNEKYVATYLVKNKLGWWPKSSNELTSLIKKIKSDSKYLKSYISRIEKVDCSFNTEQMADNIIKKVRESKRRNLHRKKILLFDLVGTLCDIPISKSNWYHINYKGVKRTLQSLGIHKQIPSKTFENICRDFVLKKLELRKKAKRILKEYEIKAQLMMFLKKLKAENNGAKKLNLGNFNPFSIKLEDRYIYSELKMAKLFKHAKSTLHKLSAHYSLYLICNNASSLLVEKILSNLGIKSYFKGIFTSADIGVRKPHHYFIHHVLKSINTKPQDCIIIGDRLNQDIKMANLAGITCIYMAITDHEDNKDLDEEFDFQVKNLKELKALLSKQSKEKLTTMLQNKGNL